MLECIELDEVALGIVDVLPLTDEVALLNELEVIELDGVVAGLQTEAGRVIVPR